MGGHHSEQKNLDQANYNISGLCVAQLLAGAVHQDADADRAGDR